MNIFWTVLGIIFAMAWVVINLVTAYKRSATEMGRCYVEGQCTVGMICANIFYAPAWFLKVLRAIVVYAIK